MLIYLPHLKPPLRWFTFYLEMDHLNGGFRLAIILDVPELPEVETVVRGLRPYLEEQVISEVNVINPKLRYLIPKHFTKDSEQSKITKVQRKAKYIELHLDNDNIIIVHLGMTGRLTIQNKKTTEDIFQNRIKQLSKHDHLILKLKNGSSLVYNDVRKFGLVDIIHNTSCLCRIW